MKYYEIVGYPLFESEKYSSFVELLKYKDRDDIYITFTNLDKVGVNPKGTKNWNTPFGVYVYPIKAAWEFYGVETGKRKDSTYQRNPGVSRFGFASSSPFIWVLQSKHGSMIDITEINEQNLNDLIEIAKQDGFTVDWIQQEINSGKKSKFAPIGSIFWRLQKSISKKTSIVHSSKLMMSIGINGICDKTGTKIIYASEPVQGVFFNPRGYSVIEKIYNRTPETRTTEEMKKIKKDTILQFYQLSNDLTLVGRNNIPISPRMYFLCDNPWIVNDLKMPDDFWVTLIQGCYRSDNVIKKIKNPSKAIQDAIDIDLINNKKLIKVNC
jgi:hypothetical protein